MNPVEHAIYQIRNAPLNLYPFPHFYVRDVFPLDFYVSLLKSIEKQEYKPLAGGFKSRTACDDPNPLLGDGFSNGYFAAQMLSKFPKQCNERFPYKASASFQQEWRFIRDTEGYKIGPHTDAPYKVLSLLFYMSLEYVGAEEGQYLLGPEDDVGTSIYVPDDHKKTCPGGPHHPFDGFSEVFRAPFVPNSCLGFWKQDNSWHGVEKIVENIQRDVLLFNIYDGSMRK